MNTDEHKFKDGVCLNCGILEEFADDEYCEEEDLSMWCAPGQTVKEMLDLAAERDK